MYQLHPTPCAPRKLSLAIALALPALVVSLPAQAVDANADKIATPQDATYNFNIPAQALESAINAFIAVSDWQVGFSSDLAQDVRSSAVMGSFTPQQALQRLLSGSGLTYRMTGGNAVTLEKVSAIEPQSATTMPTVTVKGSAQRDEDPAEQYQLSISTAGSRVPVAIEKMPQSIQVVTQKAIEDQGMIDIGQALKAVPSANVGQSRFSRFPKWTLRGFPLEVQRNGFRQLFRTDTDASVFSNVESFEILKGPGGSIYGQSGLGGSINLVSKKPKKEFAGSVSGTYGQYDLGMTDFDFTGPLSKDGALTGRITGEIERSGSFIDHQDMERENLALDLAYDAGGPVRAYLVTEWMERRTLANPGLPAIGTVVGNGVGKIARNAYLGEPSSDKLESNSPAVQAWLDIDINSQWTISPRFQYYEFNGYQNQVFLGSVAADGVTVNRTGRHGFFEEDQGYTAQLDLKGRFETFGLKHQFLAGLEYDDRTSSIGFTNYASVPAINALNPVYWLNEPALATTQLRSRVNLHNGSLYVQDIIDITDDLTFTGGMRHTEATGDVHNWFRDDDMETSATMFNVGSTYKLSDGISVFAGYGTGLDFNPSGVVSYNKVDYKPVETDQKEIGMKFNLSNGLTSTVSLFEIYRSNFITPDPNHQGFSTQLGEARSRGAEAEMNWQINDQWNVQGGYAFIDARITKSGDPTEQGNRLRNVAEHQANLWTHYEFQNGQFKGLGFGAGANFVGDRPGENFQPSYRLPSYTTLDLSASYQWEHVKAEIFALNVLDKHYFTASDFTTNAVFPGAPQTVFGRVTLRF